jgi:RNA-binding protein
MPKQDNKQLRAIGHKLKPVVTVAGRGLNEAVMQEIERALSDHELIKVKLAVGDRQARQAVADQICADTGSELIQSTGGVVLLLRRASQPDPRLSNLIRHTL